MDDDQFELFDKGNTLDNQWYNNFAAALQAARSLKWRFSRWLIFNPQGDIVRQYNSGEEMEYWQAMRVRGPANIGPVPNI